MDSATCLPFDAPKVLPLGPVDKADCSSKEFHSPQASHLPAHLEWLAPHDEQTYTVDFLAMLLLEPLRSEGQAQD